ncbi:MAG TPA: hypothetical protein VIE39_08765 [Thermoanaerobaculia bacterium]|jgi:hypothetical protein
MKKAFWVLALLALSADMAAQRIRNGCIPGTSGCGNCINPPPGSVCEPVPPGADAIIADFNRDGRSDAAFHHYSAGVKAWINYGEPDAGWSVFSPAAMTSWSAVGAGYFGPLTGNADLDADIVWQNDNTRAVRIWQMSQNVRLTNLTITCPVGLTPCTNPAPPWKIVATGYFGAPPGSLEPNDGKTDILFRNETTGVMKAWIMNGTVVAKEIALTATMPTSWHVVGAGFFDADSPDPWSDIVWFNPASGEVQVWLMKETSPGATDGTAVAQQVLVGFETNLAWNAKAVVDLQQDGRPDILFRKEATGNMRTWWLTGTALSGVVPLSVPDTATPWKLVP